MRTCSAEFQCYVIEIEINNLPVNYQCKAQCFIFQLGWFSKKPGRPNAIHILCLERKFREDLDNKEGHYLKGFLATYKRFYSKIRSEARFNKRHTYHTCMLLKNYDSIYFRTSREIIKYSVKYSKNLGANIHMHPYSAFLLKRPVRLLIRYETVGLLIKYTVPTNPMEDGFFIYLFNLHSSLRDLQKFITSLFNHRKF